MAYIGRPHTSLSGIDPGLDSISDLTTAADKMIYTTGSDAYAVTTITSAARGLLDDASVGDMRTTLGLGTMAEETATNYLTTSAAGTTYATLASPALTGNPTTPTQAAGNSTTRLASTEFVSTAVANIVDSAPAALNTLNELAASLGDDVNFSTTVTNSIATKMPLAGGTFTGDVNIESSAPTIYFKDSDGTANNYGATYFDADTMYVYTRNGSSHGKIILTSFNGTDQADRLTIDTSGNATFSGGITAAHHVNVGVGMSFQWGDSHERIEQSDGNIEFFTGNGEKMRLHGSTLVIGKDSADTTLSGGTPPFQVIGTGSSASIAAVRREANAYGSSLILAKSRGTTVNSFSNSTKLSDNDALGYILFIGDDGTDLDTYGATIHAEVNGTPGSNDMPADLVFSTNGGSSSATERMRIDSSGNVGIGVTSPKTKLQIVGENNSSSTPLGKIANSQLHLDHTTHTNAISQIGFGYSAGTYSTASIGYISTLVNNYGKGDLFFATRNVNTDTAPTERFRIATAGQLGIGGANYGTSGQVLTSGGASAAPSWADAGGGNWTTISESTVSNQRTVNFTVAAGYWYRLYITNLYLHSATRQLFAQFSTDGGSNFISSGYTVWAKTNYASSTTVQVSTENTWSYGVMITKEHLGAGADSANNMIIDYYQPTGYQFRMWGGHSNLKNSNSTHDGTFILKDLSNSSTAVNYIRLTNYGANSGTQYYIYGKFKLMRME